MINIKNYTSLKVDSFVNDFIDINNKDDLLKCNFENFITIGSGTNVFFYENYKGTVIKNSIDFFSVTVDLNYYYLEVGAGHNWHSLVEKTLKINILGLENLALIPGNVGAAPVQNIGAYGKEVCEYIESVEVFDHKTNKFIIFTNSMCEFSYRNSIFKSSLTHLIITQVNFKMSKKWVSNTSYYPLSELKQPSALDIFNKVCEVRANKLPDHNKIGNAGSFFTNPYVTEDVLIALKNQYNDIKYFIQDDKIKVSAAFLIDRSNLKGYCIGGACVHEKQPLVLINKNNATSNDFIKLANHVRAVVLEKFRVRLTAEVRFIGKDGFSDLDKALKII